MQLEQVDPLEAEAAQAQLDLLAQVLGPADGAHCPGPAAVNPALVAITRSSGYGCSASRDQLLGDVGPVGVGGVDEGDAELDGAAQDADRLVLVASGRPRRPAPVSCIVP